MPPVPEATRLYTTPFLLLCLSHALFAGSFNMMIPELPNYLRSMGGAQYIGLIIALFTVTAGASRPFSGKLTDTIGRLPVMYFGVFACIICGFLYPVMHTVAGFLWIRFFHGFSTGFKPTASSAYVADIVPWNRRGEALGILGICSSVGSSATPPLGSWVVSSYGINMMFYVSSLLAFISLIILIQLPETLVGNKKFKLSHLKVDKQDIFDPLVLPAAIVMICCYFSYGVLLTLAPDISDRLQLGNRGIYFTVFTLSSIATRFFAGKIADRVGRVPVIKASIFIIILAMLVYALCDTPALFYIASVLFGFGIGIFFPAISAWTIDLGEHDKRGRAMATMYISLEIAIGGGAFISGSYIGDHVGRVPYMFYFSALMGIIGLVYLYRYDNSKIMPLIKNLRNR
ncbi:MAG: MFS transporter [Saprospiraceae bacterium]|jgi:MFS family permease|nr:MFS transporter [Saprospiraceae bacterium]MBL0110009.1 MFS transporter [Saprospiraceae bacterium]